MDYGLVSFVLSGWIIFSKDAKNQPPGGKAAAPLFLGPLQWLKVNRESGIGTSFKKTPVTICTTPWNGGKEACTFPLMLQSWSAVVGPGPDPRFWLAAARLLIGWK